MQFLNCASNVIGGFGFFGIGLVLKVVIEAATLTGIKAGHGVDQAGHGGGLFRCQAATAAARVRMDAIVEACHVALPSLVVIPSAMRMPAMARRLRPAARHS